MALSKGKARVDSSSVEASGYASVRKRLSLAEMMFH